MGHWNYRILRHDKTWGPEYTVHEVYYDDEGQPEGWGPAKILWGESVKAVNTEYLVMADAFKHEALVVRDGDRLELESHGDDG